MRAIREHFGGAAFFERFCRFTQRVRSFDKVINDYAGAAFDFADNVHYGRDVRTRTPLVDDCKIRFQAFSERAGAHDAADVRRDHDQVLEVVFPHVAEKNRS